MVTVTLKPKALSHLAYPFGSRLILCATPNHIAVYRRNIRSFWLYSYGISKSDYTDNVSL